MTLVPANSRGANAVSSVFGRTGVVAAANGDYNGVVASALTGATAATRYVGGTASGAPVSGTFAVGDFVIDQTAKVYVCTVLGTPGTWVQVGGGGGGFAVGSSAIVCEVVDTAAFDMTGAASVPFSQLSLAGSDLSVNGMDNTVIDIATSGWYSWGFSALVANASIPANIHGLLIFWNIPVNSAEQDQVANVIGAGVNNQMISATQLPFAVTAPATLQFNLAGLGQIAGDTAHLDDGYLCVTRFA